MDGPFCDDGWDLEDGHVICKELGFLSALEITKESFFGPVYKDFTTNHVQCIGNEAGLEFCQRKDRTFAVCSRKEAAGVFCKTAEFNSSHQISKRAAKQGDEETVISNISLFSAVF